MIIYLYGLDSYRRHAKLNEILAEYARKNPAFILSHFELVEDGAVTDYKAFLHTQSLFHEKRVAVIDDVDTERTDVLAILKSSLDANTTTILSVPKKLTKPYAFLEKKPAASQAFEKLEGAELHAFLKKEAAQRAVTLTSQEESNLLARWGSDTWGIVTDLEARSLGSILASPIIRPDFFPLVQRLKSGTLRDRLSALAFILEYEESAAAFNVLASLTTGATKQKMADYDVAIKSGKLEYEEVLTDFVLSSL